MLYGLYAAIWLNLRGGGDLACLSVLCGLEIAGVSVIAAGCVQAGEAWVRRLRGRPAPGADDLIASVRAIQALLGVGAVAAFVGELAINQLIPLGLRSEREVWLRGSGFLAQALLFGWLLRHWLLRLRRPGQVTRRRALLAWYAGPILIGLVAVAIPEDAARRATEAPTPTVVSETGLRVCLIGIDAASWKVVDPLLREGKLPWLAALEQGGVRATLVSEAPYSSPCLWVSISTGVPRQVHGIDDYVYVAIPGVRRFSPSGILREPSLAAFIGLQFPLFAARWIRFLPPTRDDCRAPMLWERASAAGRPAIAVNWTASWPARPVHGAILSDRYFREIMWMLLAPEPARSLVAPPEWEARLAGDLDDPETAFSEPCRTLADFTSDEIDHMAHARLSALAWDPLPMLRRMFNIDRNCIRAFGRVAREVPFRLACLQLDANDMVSHGFWAYRFPADFPVLDAGLAQRHRTVLERFWIHLDAELSQAVPAADERTVVVVFSDHGIFSQPDGYPHLAGHEREGILIAAGGPLRRGIGLADGSIYDLAPTALYLLGIPVPARWQGRVISDAIEDTFLQQFPLSRAASER